VHDLIDPANSEASLPFQVFLLNGQSRGDVTLQSAKPNDPPRMDPNLFSHPFDRRVAIEATRQVLEIMESPAFARDTVGVVDAPKSKSDEDILVCLHIPWIRRYPPSPELQECIEAC
jgi:choline dehydrogenase-like flavoprotein